jgi:hypothetical protein
MGSNLQKRLVLSVLVAAFAQKEIAVATTMSLPMDQVPSVPKVMPTESRLPSPLKQPRITDDAAPLIQIAQSRSMNEYFGASNAINDVSVLTRFEADLEKVLQANVMIGFAGDADRFRSWYATRKAELLLSRGLMGSDVNLQSYFANVFLKFKADMAQEDTSVFTKWIEQQLNNDTLKMVSDPTFWFVVGTAVFMKDIVKGATIAGPLGGIVSAFVEPVVRPIREKVTLIGARLLTGWGSVLTRVLFREPKAKGGSPEAVEKAAQSQKEAVQYLNSLGFDMTPQQFSESTNRIQDAYNQYNQIWLTTEPGSYQAGRDRMTDSLIMRMQSFSNAIFNAHQLAETYRQGIETQIERAKAQNPSQAQTIENVKETLFSKMQEQFLIDKSNGVALQAAATDIQNLKQELVRAGVSEPIVNRVVYAQNQVMLASRHAATSAASFLLHEMNFREYNRRLPGELYQRYLYMRQNFGLEFYTKLYAKEVVTHLAKLGVEITILDAVQKDMQNQDKHLRAMEKISQVNEKPDNVRAIDRLGENRAGDKSEDRRVRDALSRAGKK